MFFLESSPRPIAFQACESRIHEIPGQDILVPLLAGFIRQWQEQTPYAQVTDWVFASARLKGKQPRVANMLVEDHLRPAAVKAGVLKEGEKVRFGFHNLRHSLASFLVRKGTDVKTIQKMFATATFLRRSEFTLTA